MDLMGWGPTVHPGWVKALSDVGIRSARPTVEISQDRVLPPVSMDQLTYCPAAWGHDQQAELSPAPTTRGRQRARTCSGWLCSQGQRWLQWIGESRQAQNVYPGTSKPIRRRQGHGSATLSISTPPHSYLPRREVVTGHALNHPHHRNRSEIPACRLPQLLSSGKMSKSQHPSSSSEIRCCLSSLSHLHSFISSFHRTDLLYWELILCIISYCLY